MKRTHNRKLKFHPQPVYVLDRDQLTHAAGGETGAGTSRLVDTHAGCTNFADTGISVGVQ